MSAATCLVPPGGGCSNQCAGSSNGCFIADSSRCTTCTPTCQPSGCCTSYYKPTCCYYPPGDPVVIGTDPVTGAPIYSDPGSGYFGGGGGGPPPEPISRTCGQECDSTDQCKRANSASVCKNGICVREGCEGYTEEGANCACLKPRGCGETCGLAYGICSKTPGITCGYVSNANACSDTQRYCLPDRPRGFYSRKSCTDTSGTVLVKPDGSTPTTAGSTTASPKPSYTDIDPDTGVSTTITYKNDLELACKAPAYVYTVRVCQALLKNGLYRSDWDPDITGAATLTEKLYALPAEGFSDDGTDNRVFIKDFVVTDQTKTNTVLTIPGSSQTIPAYCETYRHRSTDALMSGIYLYDRTVASPDVDNWNDVLYHDDYEKTFTGTSAMYFDEDYSDGVIDFGTPTSQADLTRTLLVTHEYSNSPFCYKRVYVPNNTWVTKSFPNGSYTHVSIPPKEDYQAIGIAMAMGDYGQNMDFGVRMTTIDANGVETTPSDFSKVIVSRCGSAKECSNANRDLCTTSWNTFRMKTVDYLLNPTVSVSRVRINVCGTAEDHKPAFINKVTYVYRKTKDCALPTFAMQARIYNNPSGRNASKISGGVCVAGGSPSGFGDGSIEATDQNNVSYPGTVTTSGATADIGKYSVASLPMDGTYCLNYTPPDGYRCACPVGCSYCGRRLPTGSVNVNDSTGVVTSIDPITNLRFYVTLASNNWFQTIGGDVAALAKSGTSIRSPIPALCSGSCSPYLTLPFVSGNNATTGSLTVGTGSNVDLKDTAGYQSTNVGAGTSHLMYQNSMTCKENYDYFYRLYSLGTNPTDDFPDTGGIGKPGSLAMRNDASQMLSDVLPERLVGLVAQVVGGNRGGGAGATPTPGPDVVTPDPTSTPVPGTVGGPAPVTPVQVPPAGKPYYFNRGDMTINTPWTVNSGEKIVVFVDGTLTIDQPITVAYGGFLAFIVSGNISISEHIGTTTFAAGSPGQVQGIYIANGTLDVESAGPDVVGQELKFVGEGTFVGCNGISLSRNFENGGNAPQNNSNPANLIIYRPDFVLNAPDKMKVPDTNWKEVAP